MQSIFRIKISKKGDVKSVFIEVVEDKNKDSKVKKPSLREFQKSIEELSNIIESDYKYIDYYYDMDSSGLHSLITECHTKKESQQIQFQK